MGHGPLALLVLVSPDRTLYMGGAEETGETVRDFPRLSQTPGDIGHPALSLAHIPGRQMPRSGGLTHLLGRGLWISARESSLRS